MQIRIEPLRAGDVDSVVGLALRAWDPVFARMQPAVPGYVYRAFYPEGWRARQAGDVASILQTPDVHTRLAWSEARLLGFIGVRLHPADRMGEVHIIGVEPGAQRQGVATALIDWAFDFMRSEGAEMAMVETGDDPGHAPSRAVYESLGFDRWPVARYFRSLRDPT